MERILPGCWDDVDGDGDGDGDRDGDGDGDGDRDGDGDTDAVVSSLTVVVTYWYWLVVSNNRYTGVPAAIRAFNRSALYSISTDAYGHTYW